MLENIINLKEIIGYDLNNLPTNDFNSEYSTVIKLRTLFKTMLHVHSYLNFERHFDPDLNHYIQNNQIENYYPINYDPEIYTKTRIANCGIYSNYFELLTKSLGFDVRHIGLKTKIGKGGHWCSEIKVDNKWIFFDAMYLICSPQYSAKDIMEDPINRYYNLIHPMLKGVSEKSILNLWEGLEINKETTYELGKEEFFKKYYGE